MDATTRFDTQVIGALLVITQYFERLRIAATVDELVPWEGQVPLGTVVEILIANRMLNPKALFRVGKWAGQAGLTDYYGVTADQLNDDLLGRAMERIVAHWPAVQGALVLKAIREFKLKVKQVHYDVTSVELFGAYNIQVPEGQDPPSPMPSYGHTKSGRKNVKQVQLGLNVTADGGVPLTHLPLDGNAAESKSHLTNLKQLAQVIPTKSLIYMADSKLDSPENFWDIVQGGGFFLCAGAMLPHMQEKYLKVRDQLRPVDHCPRSQAHLPPEEQDKYQGVEISETVDVVVEGRKRQLTYRVMFIHSEGKARQEAATRERHVAKIGEDFASVQKNLGKYKLKTREAIVTRLEKAKARYHEGDLFDYQLTERRGKFDLQWSLNAKALERRKQLEGVYCLKSNLSRKTHPIDKALGDYKGQACVERRFHHLKGPLAVTPMFLEKPARIAGMMCILVTALMVLALMERQVRQELKGQPMRGLYPENRPSPSPTGPAILQAFETLCIVIVKHHGETTRRLADLTSVQRKLIELLSIPPGVLQTFRRRCGM